jgi:hypothetical protein
MTKLPLWLLLNDQAFVNLPTAALETIFNSQNILYIPPVKNCLRLEFEQTP